MRFYGEAFAGEPKLAEDLTTQDRYNAACAAVQAGCLKGKDAAMPDAKDRAQMRQQALDWLRADLAFYARLADITPEEVHAFVQKRMQHWLKDANLAGVRGEALAQLPQAERQAWQQLWTTVEETLRKATHKDGKDTQKKP